MTVTSLLIHVFLRRNILFMCIQSREKTCYQEGENSVRVLPSLGEIREARAGKEKIQTEVLDWPTSFEMREKKGEFGRMIIRLK